MTDRRAWLSAVRAMALTALVFCIVVGALLAHLGRRLYAEDPLNAPALVVLRERYAAAPANEALRDEIRARDLAARRAYFTAQARLRRGAWLLAAGLVVLAVLTAAAEWLRPDEPAPSRSLSVDGVWESMRRRRRAIALAGAFLLVAILIYRWLA